MKLKKTEICSFQALFVYVVLISQGSKSNLLYGVTQVSSSRLFCLRSTLIFIEEADITQSGLQWGPKKEKLQNKKKKQSSMSSKYKKKHLSNIANKSKLRKAENIKNNYKLKKQMMLKRAFIIGKYPKNSKHQQQNLV